MNEEKTIARLLAEAEILQEILLETAHLDYTKAGLTFDDKLVCLTLKMLCPEKYAARLEQLQKEAK